MKKTILHKEATMRLFFILLVSLFFLTSCDAQSTKANEQATEKDTWSLTGEEFARLAREFGATPVPDEGEAVKRYRKAAERGDADAQFNLGVSYANGEGVPEDAREAVKWFRRAAEQGDAWAQGFLGVRYAKGEGVPQDFVEAYAWLNIASTQGAKKKAVEYRDLLKKQLDRASLAKAQERSREYFKKYVVPSP